MVESNRKDVENLYYTVRCSLLCHGTVEKGPVRTKQKLYSGGLNMKKKMVNVALASCLAIGLTAGYAGGGMGTVFAEEGSGAKTELELWHYWDGPNQKLMEEYAAKFNEQSEDIEVTVAYVPIGEFNQKVLTAASAGKGPDILIYGVDANATLAASGVLGDMTDIVKEGGFEERILPEVLRAHDVDGKYYGLPIYSNCLGLFYNKDMIETPPKTWDELMTVAEEVTTDETYAISFCAFETEEGVFQFLPWLWSAGADLDSLDSENGIAAMTLYKDLVDKGYASKEVVGWSQQDAMLQFASGRAAMMVNGPWQVPAIAEQNADLNYGVSVLPALNEGESASILGGESFGISTNADMDAAKEFFDWIYSEEVYDGFLKGMGQLPAEEALLMDDYYQNDPVQKAFADNLLVAKPRAYGVNYNEMSKAIQTAISATLSGMQTPEEAMKEAAAVVTPLLEQ